MASCSCSICNLHNTQRCIKERCDCCSVEHAFLLTNNSFEEMVLNDSRFDQAHIPYNR
jgi:hypothetical protein